MIIVCKENEYYNSCMTPCELTCNNYKNPPFACNAMCISGCACKQGYVFKTGPHGNDGCIKPEECP